VHAGEEAEIKIDTFNFTRYGLSHGRVQAVSQDAIMRETRDGAGENPSDKRRAGDESDSSEPERQELVYSTRVSFNNSQMQMRSAG
jgi:hemolysin D